MHKEITFKLEDKLWYVDLPGFVENGFGQKIDLLMVAGADTLLDVLANENESVTMIVSDEPFDNCEQIQLIEEGFDENVLIEHGHRIVSGGYYFHWQRNHMLWLCPTLLHVFETSKYPKNIYFLLIDEKR